ncbi:MAG: ABC transporter permease [Verrucomicrobiae bacterium]|nr:ABC transporter permease [Verrucomicrobiae bacterium]
MNWLKTLRTRFRALFRKRQLDAEMDEEMRAHIELRTQANIEAGMNPEEARFAALRQFGWRESIKEECRDQRGVRWLEHLLQDIRYGTRQLRKNPGFTIVAVLTLALGIGATTAIFSVVEAVLLRPLPFPHPERLFAVDLQGGPGTVSGGDFENIRASSQAFSQVAVFSPRQFNLSGEAVPERILSSQVSDGFFPALGVEPLMGRGFLPEEYLPGGEKVAVLSYGLWQRWFGGDRDVVGRPVTLDGESYLVVGVMPPVLNFPHQTALWTPLALGSDTLRNYTGYFLKMIVRLKPGVTVAAGLGELSTISSRVASDYPDYRKKWVWKLTSLHEQLAGPARTTLLVLLGAVGLVVCIACANVANLLLTQAARRHKEISLRMALGATRRRLLRQILTESLVLAGLGGVAGLTLAYGSIDLLRGLLPASLLASSSLAINGVVLGFTLGISVAAGLFFGMAPAWQVWRPDLSASLNEGGRSSTGGLTPRRLQSGLVIAEVALTFMLLTGAGVLIKSFYLLNQVSLGFQPERVLTARIDLAPLKYSTSQQRRQFQQEILERTRSLSGVQNAGVISALPFSDARAFSSFSVEGRAESDEILFAGFRSVGGDYFRALRIPLLQGREFDTRDREESLPVTVINEAMARKYWPQTSPIGQRVKAGAGPWTEIVGVVGSIRHDSMEKAPEPEMFFPFAQSSGARINLVIRTGSDPAFLAASIRDAVTSLDREQPVFGIQTMRQRLSESVAEPRWRVLLLGTFAGLALVLALVGIYGVISCSVAQRTQEIGIRMALGAQGRDVLALVLGHGFRLTLIGLVLGLGGAVALTRFLAGLLYQVKPTDAFTFGIVLLLLPMAALLACYFPARRATQVAPMAALRGE